MAVSDLPKFHRQHLEHPHKLSMPSLNTLIGLAGLAAHALAQSSTAYTDSGITFQGITAATYDFQIGFVTPPAGAAQTDEFVAEIVSPSANKWVSR